MRIEFDRTPDQVELVRAMGSRDKTKRMEALEAFAAFITPVVQTVLNTAGFAQLIYRDLPYDQDDSPSIPLDLYLGKIDNYVQVWTQNSAGGLPSSEVRGLEEMKVSDYNLTSAIHWSDRYARKARLDVIAAGLNRLAQEILVKQERNAWAVILKALAEGTTNGNAHVITTNTTSQLQLHDFNKLLTRHRRIYTSFNKGTPVDALARITDMFLSPEMMEEIRGFAYQPMNTRATPNTDESTALGLPDSVREDIFRNAGAAAIYGVGLNEMLEFGTNQKYNTLFDNFYTGSFTGASDEIIVAIDSRAKEAFIRPVVTDEGGGQVRLSVDDQWVSRSEKSGYWATVTQGNACIDSRVCSGLIC